MADADVVLTAVSKDGANMNDVIPAGSMAKEDGKAALPGTWQITGAGKVTLEVSGSSVKSVEKPFGNQPLMAEIEESTAMLGLHVTMGGFPLKAWMAKEGGNTFIKFSNGGKWTKC